MSPRDSSGHPPSPLESRERSQERQPRMATTHLPPLGVHSFAPPPIHFPGYDRNLASLDHERVPFMGMADSSIRPMPEGHRARQTRNAHSASGRSQGAVPLSKILSSEPSKETANTNTSSKERMQISPRTILSPTDTEPVRSIGQQTRSTYFDPARDFTPRDTRMAEPSPLSSPACSSSRGSEALRASSIASYNKHESLRCDGSVEYDYKLSQPLPTPQPSPRFDSKRYRLKILQQPEKARACGHGERDRRVIDPPPILQLFLADYDPDSEGDRSMLSGQYNIVQCRLYSATSKDCDPSNGFDVTETPDSHHPGKSVRRLMGTLNANPFVGTNPFAPADASENARLGAYYIFQDISCRQSGLYRLKFELIPLDLNSILTGGRTDIAATVMSDVFEVLSAKEFPGMSASTFLTKDLKRQGATVSVKKGVDAGRKTRKTQTTSSPRGSFDMSDSDEPNKTLKRAANDK